MYYYIIITLVDVRSPMFATDGDVYNFAVLNRT